MTIKCKKIEEHHLKTNTKNMGRWMKQILVPLPGAEEIKQIIYLMFSIVSKKLKRKDIDIPKQLIYTNVTNKCKDKRPFISEFIISTRDVGSTEERGGGDYSNRLSTLRVCDQLRIPMGFLKSPRGT